MDKAVLQADKEAKEKALQLALNQLELSGYTKEQLNLFKEKIITPCINSDNAQICFQTSIEQLCNQHPNIDCDKLTQNFKDAKNKYIKVYNELFYYGKFDNLTTSLFIDQINKDEHISLEGSKQVKTLAIKDNQYIQTITLQPYEVILIELSDGNNNLLNKEPALLP